MPAAVTHGGVCFAATVAADLTELVAVRDALAGALETCSWSEEDAFRVLLCADEAIANACEHGEYGLIDVRFDVDATAASFTVDDRRGDTVPIPTVATPPAESCEHGRGLILMRALADTFRVSSMSLGTRVALSFCAGGV